MNNQNCGYCMKNELLDPFGIYICDLDASVLVLFKEQSHPGRCIVAYKDHKSEMVELTDEERSAFFADVNRAAKALHAIFHPDKINYGAYGDTSGHLHFHLVPKYRNQYEWDGIFQPEGCWDDSSCKKIGHIRANHDGHGTTICI